MDDWPGEDPEGLVMHFIQRDSQGAYRVITHNGLNELVDISGPLTEPDALSLLEHLGYPAHRVLSEARLDLGRKWKVFGKKWDGVDWWETKTESDSSE